MSKETTTTELARQDLAQFDDSKIDLLKRVICKDATNDELELFIHACKRTGLDPFMNQIHFVKRKGKMTVQTGIDGYRLIAERTRRYVPGREPTFTYNKEGFVVSSTAFVKKLAVDNTWHEYGATAHFDEYCCYTKEGDLHTMWATKPHIMLSKCAEALALRRGFPAELSGVYTKEEMEQADNPAPSSRPVNRTVEQPHPDDDGDQRGQDERRATEDQVDEINALLDEAGGLVPMKTWNGWLAKAGAKKFSDMKAATIDGCIKFVKGAIARSKDKFNVAKMDRESKEPQKTTATRRQSNPKGNAAGATGTESPAAARTAAKKFTPADVKTWPKFLNVFAEVAVKKGMDAEEAEQTMKLAVKLSRKAPDKTTIQWRLAMLKAVGEGSLNQDGTIGAPAKVAEPQGSLDEEGEYQ